MEGATSSNPRVRRRRAPWSHPAIVILFITGCFHLYRGAPIDAVAFLLVAIGLAIAETVAPAHVVPAHRPRWGRTEHRRAAALVTLVALVVAVAPRYGAVDILVVCLVGVLAVLDAAARPDTEPPPARGRAWPYAVVGVVAALNELTGFLVQTYTGRDYPVLSDLLNPVFGWPPTRALLTAGWLAGGVAMLRLLPRREPATEVER